MKLSVNHLKNYVDINIPVKELADKLTMTGLEVEEIKDAPKAFFTAQGGAGVADDTIFDVKVTPNRGDWLSLIGVAREVAPICGTEVKIPAAEVKGPGAPTSDSVKITVTDSDLCKRYVGVAVRNVKIGPSPDWMKDVLVAAGMRPINNIVDITNYVMLELGQPLHAFDMDLIDGKEVIVRVAKDGEKIKTLDGEDRELTSQNLVIADSHKPVAVAGVMGGFDSEIGDNVKNVLIESANFDAVSVRRTSKRLGLSTEASFRYERGVDVNIAGLAAARAAELMAEYAGGEVACEAIDVYPNKVEPIVINARVARINGMLGTDFGGEEMAKYLESLDIKTTVKGDMLECVIPTFRVDIVKEIDLVEEVGRMFGYDNLEPTLPASSSGGKDTAAGVLRDKIRRILVSSALQEVLTHSLVSSKIAELTDMTDTMLKIKNPMNEDLDVMRSSIMPNLMGIAARNQALGINDVFVFETGKVYWDKPDKGIGENLSAAGLMLGNMWNNGWGINTSAADADFFMCKGLTENLFADLGIKNVKYIAAKAPAYHPTRCAAIYVGDVKLGVVGEVAPDTCRFFDVSGRPCAFELDFDAIRSVTPEIIRHSELSRYPGSYRHIAVVAEEKYKVGEILAAINAVNEELVESVKFIDIYRGVPIESGKKSVTFAFVFRSLKGTLKDEEVNAALENIKAELVKRFDCTFRG
ncbi:MAG: phenylalanine--tRNA ligase subunit beta [Abditibacteriota bacterium]|nr:phenylalanine--tRNA ligase subunit beta [Abditibacteriota bacterium]